MPHDPSADSDKSDLAGRLRQLSASEPPPDPAGLLARYEREATPPRRVPTAALLAALTLLPALTLAAHLIRTPPDQAPLAAALHALGTSLAENLTQP